MKLISLDAAVSVTTISRRTLWRRMSEGEISRGADDARGRAMLAWEDVSQRLALTLVPEDLQMLANADAGDVASQNDIGQLLASAGLHDGGIYWIKQAAEQGHPDAMQWLGRAYAAGEGVPKDENLALKWIAGAASLGHQIADQQIKGLLP